MYLNKILLLTDKKELTLSYKLLLKSYGEVDIEIISPKNRVDELTIKGYQIIIADLGAKAYVKEFLELANFYSFTREILILISIFDSLELERLHISLSHISFIIKKPFITSKLTNFINKEIYKIKQLGLISNKVDILIDIIDLHPARIAVYDNNGYFFYANSNYIQAHNIHLEEVKSLHFNEISSCGYEFGYIKSKLFVLRTFNFQKEEETLWYENLFFYTTSKYIIHIISDITPQKQKELSQALASTFFENTNDGIIITNKNGDIESVNKAFTMITGYSKDEAIGQNPRLLKSGLHDAEFYENMWGAIKANGYWKGEIWNKRKNAEVYPQILSITKTPSSNEQGYYMSVLSDISSLKDANARVYYHANYDSLTGLPNRSYFEKQFENILKDAQKSKTQVAILFIDLDKFKDVNDTYGHNVGDEMLIAIAKRLKNSVKQDDFLARIGGDEFVLLAKDIKNIKNVQSIANKIQKRAKQPLQIANHTFSMGLSIGIAIYPEHGTKDQELLKNADIAMYEVKENGRNNFKIYENIMGRKILTKTSMISEIKSALANKDFVMYYQPVIDFQSKSVIGAEALVRWNHPYRGIIPPVDFLHYIISSDMEEEFGGFVIESVMQDVQKLNNLFSHHEICIAINITREHFFTPNFCAYIATMIQKYGIKPSQIEMEILEMQIMHNTDIAKANIDNLRHMGFKISLDDFGVEYSSLNYLKHFRVDKLKVDKSFIHNIHQGEQDLRIVQSIINIGKVFDLKVQAEGVETLEQYNKIKEFGCDFSQGFYHSRPIGFEDFICYYKESTKKEIV